MVPLDAYPREGWQECPEPTVDDEISVWYAPLRDYMGSQNRPPELTDTKAQEVRNFEDKQGDQRVECFENSKGLQVCGISDGESENLGTKQPVVAIGGSSGVSRDLLGDRQRPKENLKTSAGDFDSQESGGVFKGQISTTKNLDFVNQH